MTDCLMEAEGGSSKRVLLVSLLTTLRIIKAASSYSFMTSALEGGEYSASRLGCALLPGRDPRYPLGFVNGGGLSYTGIWDLFLFLQV
jgi:hypothetical protein